MENPTLDYTKKNYRLFLASLFTIVILKLLVIIPPLLIGKIVDSLTANSSNNASALLSLVAAFAALGITQAIIHPIQAYFLARLSQNAVCSASIEWSKTVLEKEFCHFQSMRLGYLIKATERGITAYEKILNFAITQAIPLCIEVMIISACFLYLGGVELFFLLLVPSILYLLMTRLIIQKRRKHIAAVNDSEDESGAIFANTFQAAVSIKLEDAISTSTQPLNQAFKNYANASVVVASSAGILASAKILFISLSSAAFLAWGILDQTSPTPQITAGVMVAIFSIAATFLLNVAGVAETHRVLDQFFADKQQLKKLLELSSFSSDERVEPLVATSLSALCLSACKIDVDHATVLNLRTALNIVGDEHVAIVGASGAGKSSLLSALSGMDSTAREFLKLNDQPVQTLTAAAQLAALRYCPQAASFLEGPFDHAVLHGRTRADHLDKSIETLGLRTFVEGKRRIEEGATNISGGEAKRLSLLRVLNSPGLFNFFDEPSASLDEITAQTMWSLLFSQFEGKALVCVTHDLDVLPMFDRVILMRCGEIIDQGSWQELSAKSALGEVMHELLPHTTQGK